MRQVLVLLIAAAALAGCADPSASTVDVEALPAPPAEPRLVTEEVSFQVMSGLWICGAGACAGAYGPGSQYLGERHIVAFDLEVRPAGPLAAADQLAQVRIEVECAGPTCTTRNLAEATGPWPQRLQADGFYISPEGGLAFHVNYEGPLPPPVNGSGADYEVTGTLTLRQDA